VSRGGLHRIVAHRSCVRQNADARRPHSGECSYDGGSICRKVRNVPIETAAGIVRQRMTSCYTAQRLLKSRLNAGSVVQISIFAPKRVPFSMTSGRKN